MREPATTATCRCRTIPMSSFRASDGCATACCGRWRSTACRTGWTCTSSMSTAASRTLMMTETTDAWIDMHPEVDFQILVIPAIAICGRVGATVTITSTCTSSISRSRSSGPAKMVAQLTHGDWEVEKHRWRRRKAGHRLLLGQRGRLAADATSTRSDWMARTFIASRRRMASHAADFDPKNSKYYVDDLLGADHAADAFRCAPSTAPAMRSGSRAASRPTTC